MKRGKPFPKVEFDSWSDWISYEDNQISTGDEE